MLGSADPIGLHVDPGDPAPIRASARQIRSRAASSSSYPHHWAPGRRRLRPCFIENDTSRTARNEPNCLQRLLASIITACDIPLHSSPIIRVTTLSHHFPRLARSVMEDPVKREPAGRRGKTLARLVEARNPHNFFTRIGRMCSLCAGTLTVATGYRARTSMAGMTGTTVKPHIEAGVAHNSLPRINGCKNGVKQCARCGVRYPINGRASRCVLLRISAAPRDPLFSDFPPVGQRIMDEKPGPFAAALCSVAIKASAP